MFVMLCGFALIRLRRRGKCSQDNVMDPSGPWGAGHRRVQRSASDPTVPFPKVEVGRSRSRATATRVELVVQLYLVALGCCMDVYDAFFAQLCCWLRDGSLERVLCFLSEASLLASRGSLLTPTGVWGVLCRD
ncbi:unnamed protein product [Hapterophycus canaliculatus]